MTDVGEIRFFEGHKLTRITYQGKLVWAVNQVALALGYADDSGLLKSIEECWMDEFDEGLHYIWASGEDALIIAQYADLTNWKRRTRIMMLTEQGMYLVCLKTNKPKGKTLRRWISGDVLPEIAKSGAYRGEIPAAAQPAPPTLPPPVDTTAIVKPSHMLRAMLEQAEKVEALEVWRSEMDSRLAALEARASVPALQAPAAKSLRAALTRHMKDSATTDKNEGFGLRVRLLWQKLYLEFYDRRRIDLEQRARRRNKDRLDVAEEDGLIGELYALALEMWPPKKEAA